MTTIRYEAFKDCTNLRVVGIPASVVTIHRDAFDGTAWYNSQPDGLVYAGRVAYRYKGTMPEGTSIVISDGTLGISELAFYGCGGLTSVSIPGSVVYISPKYLFMNCYNLANIDVASTNPIYDSRNDCNAIIETESNMLIYGCQNTVIPAGVTAVGDYAFMSSNGLTSVTFPITVTDIGQHAFEGCRALSTVVIPGTLTTIGDRAFSYCPSLTDVYCYVADPSSMSVGFSFYCPQDSTDSYHTDYSLRTLHVLRGTAGAYRDDWHWKSYFGQIVEDLIPADVNVDGEVNISDINAVIDIIQDGDDGTPAADVNGDGEINIADINAVIHRILSDRSALGSAD